MNVDEAIRHMNFHWGDHYTFAQPTRENRHWTATAKFGGQDVLKADSSEALLTKVRRHHLNNGPSPDSSST
jgi:hypothetical protein